MAGTKTSLDGATTVSKGGAFRPPAYGRESMSLQVQGMVTNDIVQVQGSNVESPDFTTDTDWEQVGDDITADGMYSVELGALWYRAIVSDITGGGTITAIFAGFAS